ncbi:Histone deacetylase family protein [Gammaproteobacteria bacterium]
MTVALISHTDCTLHEMGQGHPESPDRLFAIQDLLISSRLDAVLPRYDAPLVTREQLTKVHDPAYVDRIFRVAPQTGYVALDPDTLMCSQTLPAALHAAGAVVQAVDLVMRQVAQQAFCAIRPPGHHAEQGRAMGFCVFNNVAVGVGHALAHYALERVAVVDFDVHHGNGTEHIFRNDPRVLLCSTFQHPFYPYSPVTNHAHLVEVPLAAGTSGDTYRQLFKTEVLPALERFQPELILLSAGFDAHREDPLGGLQLDESDYAWITRQVQDVANRFAAGRIVSVLEGGYALNALARSVVAHLQILATDCAPKGHHEIARGNAPG